MKNQFYKKNSQMAFAAALLTGVVVVPTLRAQNNTFQAGVSSITPFTQQVETGPILDVVPYVLSDGYTINLTLIPSLTDFIGYDTPPNIASVTGGLNVVQLPVILPDFTVRQVVTTVNIWDNQTVVIGGLISSQVSTTKDKVPVLGDIPLIGNLFQSSSKSTIKKNLMIFVTATIVDPAGNRVHSDDELPFAQNTIPTQPPADGRSVETIKATHSVPLAGEDQSQ
jgi:general secretion pathway protein D